MWCELIPKVINGGKKEMNYIIYVLIGMALFIAAIADIKHKSISISQIVVTGILCVIGSIICKENNIYQTLGGLSIGVMVMGISKLGSEQVGMGDGMIIALIGFFLGMNGCFIMVCTASFMMVFIAAAVLILKRGNKYTKLPFLPALFVGYVVCAVTKF